ncbi:MAG: DUF4062 domain-containing protein [Bacteroidota bacterium]
MKIFISSTFEDLEEHRKSVEKILHRSLEQFVGMEHFGSRPSDAKEVCFKEVGQCDFFIGIYAHRYGYIPKGDETSITEQEFDYAVKHKKPCYCYIIDDNHPWPPALIDNNPSLKKFKTKVSEFVRSKFTTPDNLAKQIIADLKRNDFATPKDCNSFLHQRCLAEINSVVGRKYIRDLYVERGLEKVITKSNNQDRIIQKSIKQLTYYCELLVYVIENGSLDYGGNEKKQRKRVALKEELREKLPELKNQIVILEELSNYPTCHIELCYPADKLSVSTDNIFNVFKVLDKSIDLQKERNKEVVKSWNEVRSNIPDILQKLSTNIKPVGMIVDRAGGGKTNLLCSLTEKFSTTNPVLFLAAKTISEPTAASIRNKFLDTYSIDFSNLNSLVNFSEGIEKYILVVIDGINEHLNPKEFNIALQEFIRANSNLPLKYIITCRDIYWKYFEDDWWKENCSHISIDKLFSFTRNELLEALPNYFHAYSITAKLNDNTKKQLQHPLLLRFFCEAYKETDMGVVHDIRLLELFDTYCEKKYEQIQQKLGLVSPYEIYEYITTIADMMYDREERFIPIESLRKKMKDGLENHPIHSIRSMYVQVLDEDIIIEQKPYGTELNLKVEFVYDEFMEYVIAKSLWLKLLNSKNNTKLKDVIILTKKLLIKEKNFVSVAGVIVFIGELFAANNPRQKLEYIDWLIQKERIDLSFRIISRWPKSYIDQEVFKKLLYFYKHANNQNDRKEILHQLEPLSHDYWPIFFPFIMELETSFHSDLQRIKILGNVEGGPEKEKIKSINWIYESFKDYKNPVFMPKNNVANAIKSINRIYLNSQHWTSKEIKLIEKILNQVKEYKRIIHEGKYGVDFN